jgi:hypothetical protein
MSVNFLFYSTQRLVDDAVVFFVVVADFANERNQHSETTTDKSHHDLSIHRITQTVLVLVVGLGCLDTNASTPKPRLQRRILFCRVCV